ncbi:MAG: Mth938-like domain-containing protein [Proteobacteria bacterium]|nr:Mth938-like domain-containing protein [Pseudomonadota bacterium]
MQISLDTTSGNQIKSYSPGKIQINESFYENNIILTPTQIIPWSIASFDQFREEHLNELMALNPTVIILGTGHQQHWLSQKLIAMTYEKNIGIEIMMTDAACRTYNVLLSEKRNVVAGLIV